MSKSWKLAFCATLIAAAATTASPRLAAAATPADTLVVAKAIDDIISLDPAEAYELSGIEMITNVYDRIMRFEAADVTKLVGGAAESWTISDDGKTFSFKLRKGLTFHSGAPSPPRTRPSRLSASSSSTRRRRSSSTSSAGPRTTST